jgi:hypothetical protein
VKLGCEQHGNLGVDNVYAFLKENCTATTAKCILASVNTNDIHIS